MTGGGQRGYFSLCVCVCVYSYWFRILYYHAVKELLGPGTAVQMKVKSHSVSHRCMETHSHTWRVHMFDPPVQVYLDLFASVLCLSPQENPFLRVTFGLPPHHVKLSAYDRDLEHKEKVRTCANASRRHLEWPEKFYCSHYLTVPEQMAFGHVVCLCLG